MTVQQQQQQQACMSSQGMKPQYEARVEIKRLRLDLEEAYEDCTKLEALCDRLTHSHIKYLLRKTKWKGERKSMEFQLNQRRVQYEQVLDANRELKECVDVALNEAAQWKQQALQLEYELELTRKQLALANISSSAHLTY